MFLQKIIERYNKNFPKSQEGYNGGGQSPTVLGLSIVFLLLIIAIAILIHVWATVLVLKCGKLLGWSSLKQTVLILLIWLGGFFGQIGMILSGLLTFGIIIYGLINCPKANGRSKSV